MAETTKLKLPKISDNMTADVVRDINGLADAVDAKAGAAGGLATLGADGKVPAGQLAVDMSGLATKAELSAHNEEKASLTAYGHAKLSSATDSSAEDVASTPKAVKAAYDRAEQAFTQANDGKTAVANAVTAKGVTASPADTFATLASKIGQISIGKKWASGIARSSTNQVRYYDTNNNYYDFYGIDVSGFDFTPGVIIVFKTDTNFDTTFYYENISIGSTHGMIVLHGRTFGHIPKVINNGSFQMPVQYPNLNYNWIAVEGGL